MQTGGYRCFFVVIEPGRLQWAIWQQAINREGEQTSRQAFEQKQPLPAAKREGAVQAENNSGKRCADKHGQWIRGLEHRDATCEPGFGKPNRQIEDHRGEKSRLNDSQEKTECVEARWVPDEGVAR